MALKCTMNIMSTMIWYIHGTATEDKNDSTVLDLIDEKQRKDLFPVGRLDKEALSIPENVTISIGIAFTEPHETETG